MAQNYKKCAIKTLVNKKMCYKRKRGLSLGPLYSVYFFDDYGFAITHRIDIALLVIFLFVVLNVHVLPI